MGNGKLYFRPRWLRSFPRPMSGASHFRVDLSRGAAGETWLQTLMETHAGGTWTLQSRVPGGTWVDTDVTHNDDGVKRWTASPRHGSIA